MGQTGQPRAMLGKDPHACPGVLFLFPLFPVVVPGADSWAVGVSLQFDRPACLFCFVLFCFLSLQTLNVEETASITVVCYPPPILKDLFSS